MATRIEGTHQRIESLKSMSSSFLIFPLGQRPSQRILQEFLSFELLVGDSQNPRIVPVESIQCAADFIIQTSSLLDSPIRANPQAGSTHSCVNSGCIVSALESIPEASIERSQAECLLGSLGSLSDLVSSEAFTLHGCGLTAEQARAVNLFFDC